MHVSTWLKGNSIPGVWVPFSFNAHQQSYCYLLLILNEISWMFKCIFVIMSDEGDASLQTNWPTIVYYTKTQMWWWCLALAQMLMCQRENRVGIKKSKSRNVVSLIGQGHRSMHLGKVLMECNLHKLKNQCYRVSFMRNLVKRSNHYVYSCYCGSHIVCKIYVAVVKLSTNVRENHYVLCH